VCQGIVALYRYINLYKTIQKQYNIVFVGMALQQL